MEKSNIRSFEINEQEVEFYFEDDIMWIDSTSFNKAFPITNPPQYIRDEKFVASHILLGNVNKADPALKIYTRLFVCIVEAYRDYLNEKSESKYTQLKRDLFGDDVA